MSGRQGGGRRDKVLIPPINFIFRLLTSHAHVSIWLYEQLGFRIEGYIRASTLPNPQIRLLRVAELTCI
jgi:small nuclear ribonucleoprotein E